MDFFKTETPKQRILHTLLPLLIYLLSVLVARLAGFTSFHVPWNAWQLLDGKLLLEKPLQSLILLHAQPPGLNLLSALTLQISTLLRIHAELVAYFLFVMLGCGASIYLFRLITRITGSYRLAVLSVLLFTLNPTSWLYGHQFFYPFILACLMILLATHMQKFLWEKGRDSNHGLLPITATIILIVNVRSLFHPVWGMGLFFLLAGLYALIHKENILHYLKSNWLMIILLLVGLLIWPLKNMFLFGQFTSTSWQGFNLSRGTEVTSAVIENYRREGVVPASIQSTLDQFQKKHNISEPNVLSQINKSTGGRNWNHYLYLDQNPELTRKAISYRLHNPLHWIKQTIFHYITWTRPSYINPYTGELFGPHTPLYDWFAGGIKNTLFFDLRPPLGKLIPSQIQWPHVIRLNKDVPFTVFGFLIFPFLLFFSLRLARKKWVSNKRRVAAYLTGLLYNVLWVLAIPCVTDGFEGNRMRYAIFPLLIILFVAILSTFTNAKTRGHQGHCL